MRVTFDSNAWEAIFKADDTNWELIQTVLQSRRIEGCMCAAGFRIEAITKRNRPVYFAQPFMAVTMEGIVLAETVSSTF